MRQIIKFGLIFGLIINNSAFSANPVQGLYLGLQGEISHAPNPQFNSTLDIPYTGQITMSPVGGGGGVSLGYKINNFRVEGQFLFNINNYGELQIGPCTLVSPNVFSPEGTCPAFIADNHLGFNGNIMGFYGLINGFYDFTSSDPTVNLVPYLGVGLGGAILRSHALFETNKQSVSQGVPKISFTSDSSHSGFAAQGIVGLGYYIDDYTTIGIDYRYLTTVNFSKNNNHTTNGINSQFAINTLNFVGTFVFDKND